MSNIFKHKKYIYIQVLLLISVVFYIFNFSSGSISIKSPNNKQTTVGKINTKKQIDTPRIQRNPRFLKGHISKFFNSKDSKYNYTNELDSVMYTNNKIKVSFYKEYFNDKEVLFDVEFKKDTLIVVEHLFYIDNCNCFYPSLFRGVIEVSNPKNKKYVVKTSKGLIKNYSI